MKKIVIGILAHVDSGKTTLSEAMLYKSGAINKLGRVDHRDSYLDTFTLERERGITIFSKQAVFAHGDVDFTLLDTPGHVDFSAETERTLQVLDYAILVVSGTDGVQSHTKTLWDLLKRYGVPCFVFVNKMDLAGADKARIMDELRSKFGSGCVDFTETDAAEFYENIALCDEKLLTKYYEGDEIGADDIALSVRERRVFPCLFGSALQLKGVDALLSTLSEYTVQPAYPETFAAKVFKISNDRQGNRLTHIKVTGGTLRVKEILQSAKNKNSEKVNQIRIYSGEKFTPADRADAGTVCAVTGITFARSGDGLGAEQNSEAPILEPVLTYSMILPNGIDSHTALENMRILEAEDPQLKVEWNDRAGEIRVRLMGEIQLEVLRSVIEERFGFTPSFGEGNIIYKETVAEAVEGVGHFEPLRHYAEVHLLMKPLKRDSGLVFRTDCSENMLDKNWQRLVLTHLYEKQHIGVLTGSPITDMEITLVSGRAHIKHTEGGDFRQATYRAVRQGLRSTKCLLLEPIYNFTMRLPTENVGRAIADVQRMCGTFDPPETEGGDSVLTGHAPASEMNGYAREIIGYTHGKGRISYTLRGYDVCHNADEVIARIGYDCDGDLANPADSVFCSHGAGHTVKWDEVKNHMHIPFRQESRKSTESAAEPRSRLSSLGSKSNIFALDRELMRIFEQTYGAIKERPKSADSDPFGVDRSANSVKYRKPKAAKYSPPDYLLVDGYNVIYSWDHLKKYTSDDMDTARELLINTLCNYRGYKNCEVILVFDAYKVEGKDREIEKISGINIVYTKEAETADAYIEKVSHDLAKDHYVRVVTSDALEQMIIFGGGAFRVSSREFLEEVRAVEEEIREIIAKDI